ncbi:MAG: GNAT family N-acetyltransferase [Proteobacteria bacterium]|nr:GNAT family N-acetyltransferase [Pseudomonadota bacterium]
MNMIENLQRRISELKSKSFDEAFAEAMPIRDGADVLIGRLVPCGDWILHDDEKLTAICEWRQRSMRMYLTQFQSTVELTRKYFQNTLPDPTRIFFLIYDADQRFVGHIGVANMKSGSAEIDNLMRGVEGGNTRLVYHSEVAMLAWLFSDLGIENCEVKVLSYNWMAASLHEEVGFHVDHKSKLKKNESGGVTTHEPCNDEDANVSYGYVTMSMTGKEFFDRVKAAQ